MADRGHEMTDDILNEIENRVRRTYETANIEVQEKLDDYLERFAAKDKKMREDVSAGKLSTQDYKDWRRNQMLTGKRWKALKDELAQDYVNADSIAREIAYRKMPDVYALNHDYATYQIEHDGKIDTSYTLYSRDAAYNLMEDDVNLLPYARTNSPKAKLLRERMDLIWNRQHINTAVTQGIIQGEPIHKIADRLQKVTDMDRAAALRNARTMVTSAQNKGRSDAYERLREKGVKIREKWIATLDGRTRHSHRHLHGTYKDPDTGLYANDLEYPGDPNGEPEEVYNCRCTETGEIEGFETETPKHSPKMGNMTFEEWRGEHGESPYHQSQNEQRYTLYDVGKPPQRPKRSDYGNPTEQDPYNGYNDYEKAREKYREQRAEYQSKVDEFVKRSLPSRSMSVKEMQEWCGNNNVYLYGDISDVDGRALTLFTERYEQLFKDFPMVQEYRKEHGYKGMFNVSFDGQDSFVAEASTGFTFGRQFKDLESLLRHEIAGDYAGEYRVIGDGTINQIFDHEFGHNVYSALQYNGFEHDMYGGMTQEHHAHLRNLEKDLREMVYQKDGMSEYATTNYDELFAEAFSAWYGGEQTEFAKGMGEFLKKYGAVK